MNNVSRILAVVDSSGSARAAFDQAVALGHKYRAELAVVRVLPEEQSLRAVARARAELIAKLRSVTESDGLRFSVDVEQGDPADVILDHARAKSPDLMILGNDRRTGLDRLKNRSVAERVTLAARQPVLVMPECGGADVAGGFDRIVVGVDFRVASRRALGQALALAKAPNSRITVVHVDTASTFTRVPRFMYRLGALEHSGLLTQDAWRRFSESMPRDIPPEPQVDVLVVTGDPATEIVRTAVEAHADLIVLGVTPRGAISRRLFGAAAARVMRTATQPILAVPGPASAVSFSDSASQRSRAA